MPSPTKAIADGKNSKFHRSEGNENDFRDEEAVGTSKRERSRRSGSPFRTLQKIHEGDNADEDGEDSDDEDYVAKIPTTSNSSQKVNPPPPKKTASQMWKKDKEMKKRRDEALRILKDVPFQDNDFPKNTFSLVPRHDLKLNEYGAKDAGGTGSFLPESERKCFACQKVVGPGGEELISCHGQINGERKFCERIPVGQRPFRPCTTKFHLSCIKNYNAGAFFFLYSARPECQGMLLCPLHCCHSCNLSHQRQSAYQPDLIECSLCMRSFHLETCYPIGGRDIDVTVEIDGQEREFEMMICPAHFVPQSNSKNKNRKSLSKVTDQAAQANNVADDKTVEIRNHIKRCSNPECKVKKGNKLIECVKCVRSFHRECVEVESIDGQRVADNVCEICLCKDEIHINTPVLALWGSDNKFWLGVTRDWYRYPTSKRNDVNFERLGYSVVEWVDGTNKKNMSIMPVYLMAALIEQYIPLAEKKVKELWEKSFKEYDENSLDRCPRNYKMVANTGKTSKYFNGARQKPVPVGDDATCSCPDRGIRCNTYDCENFADQKECLPECDKIGSGCNNRKISTGFIHPHIELRKSGDKGFGVFATKDINADEYLSEYVGEIIDKNVKNERLEVISLSRDFQANHYLMNLPQGYATDATTYGNISRYINHSCDPNSASFNYHIYSHRSKGRQLFYDNRNYIKTIKPIKKDEEVTFSYDMDNIDCLPACRCGSWNCDGYMTKKKITKRRNEDDEDDAPKKKKGKRKGGTSKKTKKNNKGHQNLKESSDPSNNAPMDNPSSKSHQINVSKNDLESQTVSLSNNRNADTIRQPFVVPDVIPRNAASKLTMRSESVRSSSQTAAPSSSSTQHNPVSSQNSELVNSRRRKIEENDESKEIGNARRSARGKIPKKFFRFDNEFSSWTS